MATKKTHDLAVKVGEYEKDGKTKGRYENVGAVLEGENGPYIVLKRTFNPAGVPNPNERETCLISMFKADRDNSDNQAPASTGEDAW